MANRYFGVVEIYWTSAKILNCDKFKTQTLLQKMYWTF